VSQHKYAWDDDRLARNGTALFYKLLPPRWLLCAGKLIGDFLEIIRGSRLLNFGWLIYGRTSKTLILNKNDKSGAGSRKRFASRRRKQITSRSKITRYKNHFDEWFSGI